ncbi:MAG: hypothetical protein M1816_003843 [Peltula sp. TS41687]|nr:MAG: hypothetical protein M1816_003843 [Peltula sp. TS41687]
MTPTMVTAVEEYLQIVKSSDQIKSEIDDGADHVLIDNEPSLEKPVVGNPISHGQVVDVFTTIRQHRENMKDGERSHNNRDVQLEQLLRGSKIYVPPQKPKSESEEDEYKTLMNRLRRQEEEREYERMISRPSTTAKTYQPNNRNVSKSPSNPPSPFPPVADEPTEMTYADVNRQMALVLNIIISIVACSFAIWTVTHHWSTPQRLALSLGGSILVAVAEVVVYAGYLGKLKEAKERGQDQIETKEIINTWVIGGDKSVESARGDHSRGNPDERATTEESNNGRGATLPIENAASGSQDPVLLENEMKEDQRSSGVSRPEPLPTPRRGGM